MHVVVLGGTGEVGSALSTHLLSTGHAVSRVSTREHAWSPDILSAHQAIDLLRGTGVSFVINASGPGDIRGAGNDFRNKVAGVARACRETSTPSILISTTRVMEGYDRPYAEDEVPKPLTPYGRGNALNEAFWLQEAGASATVLRATNVLLPPTRKGSPQASLLPWSLVVDAMHTGSIAVRSTPESSKSFISIPDLVTAIDVAHQTVEHPSVLATSPATVFTLAELSELVQAAVTRILGVQVSISFGHERPSSCMATPGWLHEHGWQSMLRPNDMQDLIEQWLLGLREQ